MKRVVFVTGTRADYGKLKSLMLILENHPDFETHIFVTGMHLLEKYGHTLIEVQHGGFKNINTFSNHTSEETMDLTLSKTMEGFSVFVKSVKPDLIVVHGDRVEALAGALVGALNNILVAHIEGGEISGTIDELLRHATSKMSHIHFVANDSAKKRLIQMGELPDSVFVIGSPDVDIMFSEKLPTLQESRNHYDITFERYAIAMFHPVTTEVDKLQSYAQQFVEALLESGKKYVVIFPNNDLGSTYILDAYQSLSNNENISIFPSIRFEYFLPLLKNADFIVGNSSAGIREAPYYGVPTINIGTRQENRSVHGHIINVDYSTENILEAIQSEPQRVEEDRSGFGDGQSNILFLSTLESGDIWKLNHQKQFNEL